MLFLRTAVSSLLLCFLAGCGRVDDSYHPPTGPPPEASAAGSVHLGETLDLDGDESLMIRVPAGTPGRKEASDSAPLELEITTAEAFPVVEQRGSWFHIRRGEQATWVHINEPGRLFKVSSGRPARRPAISPSPDLVRAAREQMTNSGRSLTCGPYDLYTDTVDGSLLAACDRLAGQVDSLYRSRFGVAPVDTPREAIFLFAERESFRRFEIEHGGGRRGYAAHANAARGYLALYIGPQDRDRVLETLVHELTHLVNRRALGGGLPRWLSEGLADALGDSAGQSGFEPLEGVRGAEGEATRLVAGYDAGLVRPVEELVHLRDDEFDTGSVSFDYEQSAFLVRFLVLDPALGPKFRTFLGSLADHGPGGATQLQGYLEITWPELDRRFRTWFRHAA